MTLLGRLIETLVIETHQLKPTLTRLIGSILEVGGGREGEERRDRKGEGGERDWIDFLLIFSPGTALPPNWLTLIDHGQRNESFMVWFRVAAFPVFRKLYGRIAPPNDEPLRAGNYTIDVVYSMLDLFLLPSPPFP